MRSKKSMAAAITAAALACGFGTASADSVNVQFTSSVTYVANQPVGGITTTVGAPVSGSFTYDLGAVDDQPSDPYNGEYDGGCWTLTLDGHTIGGMAPKWYVYDPVAFEDGFSMADGTPLTGSPVTIDSVVHDEVQLSFNFVGPDGTELTSDSPPTAAELSTLAIDQFNLLQTSTFGVIDYDDVVITDIRTLSEGCGSVVAVEDMSWGQLKGIYR